MTHPNDRHTDSEMMREAMSEAVVKSLPKALKDAARDPEMWSAGNDGLQEYVSQRAGSWVMKVVWMAVSRVLVFLVLGSIVYALGGWPLLAKMLSGGSK